MERIGRIERRTKETKVNLVLNIDGEGKSMVKTGVPFLDHMLTLLARHGLFDLSVKVEGDLEVDIHHTNEDVGLCLGDALVETLLEKRGIRRFGFSYVPMDKALARVVVDISGRGSLYFDSAVELPLPLEEDKYDWQSLKHLLDSFARRGGLTIHISIIKGEDFHHIVESIFKALGRALDEATMVDERAKDIPSTKGTL